MASHFARWPLIGASIRTYRLPSSVVNPPLILTERRKARYLAARSLLAELMWRVYGIPQLPSLAISCNGRPHFADPELPDFSIAYAGNIVGILLAEERGKTGLDMEIVRTHSRQTLEQQALKFSSGEKAWIKAQSDPNEAATQLWALRQSVLKLTGEKEQGNDSLRLHPASGRLRLETSADIQVISDVEPLIIWSCALSPGDVQLHLWEFNGAEHWKPLKDIQISARNMEPQMLRLTNLHK
ncbi:4'-phosphopantetheinyl transferase family protein [Erwinia psidii]|uniref:4'-phosphopantetheinyl transferase superfamily protein n=1 Tax=Erwinia psidii TaxID=69224 RepID=A0A3N6S041_9GAMM|nr:4'-phosphopantetheinyl transferase superfamily protein [Erwinia psidii]MCX8958435.1 4'-phosphopantetheinyl transferase superfamily protein [Erwinia psidii]MCX8961055.1 4'-phosphopantetheinyl transferase superfamily protein [Erwinia psidii]MCX8965517.1 4'-phosphopantetheinyl transferase superfamily protein [Erwinia psidii]RQM38854.1 4'-phosphopantetheinyl transferase superfamily protein [Erwinia psidii]